MVVRALGLGLALLASSGWAQTGGKAEAVDPRSARPDMTIVVRHHPMNADIVDITMLRADYPPQLLADQIQKLVQLLGSDARGLAVMRENLGQGSDLTFLKANFGTNGILDPATQRVNLEPIAKAFVGAPESYKIQCIMLTVVGFVPGTATIRRFHSDAVDLVGDVTGQVNGERFTEEEPGIEYRVLLLTQDPNRITIPNEYTPETPPTIREPSRKWRKALLMGFVVLIGLAGGALVYFALQKAPRRTK